MLNNISISKKNMNRVWLMIGICLLGLKFILIMGMPIYAIGNSAYDDALFIKLSQSIAKGEWLGVFDKYTLLKRPMFAVYLALIQKLNLSFRCSLIMFYSMAICALLIALRRFLKNGALNLLIFSNMLFSPIMIHSMYAQRVYRIAVMPAAVLFVIASLLGLYFSLSEQKSLKKGEIFIWSIMSGLSFFVFWNMREDSIWLLPFFVCAIIIAIIKTLKDDFRNKKLFRFKLICLIIPILITFLGNEWIKFENYRHYGVYTDSEMNHSEFGSMISTMYSVSSEDEYEYVNLTHKTLNKIVAASPSLQSVSQEIEGIYQSNWVMENGEVAGGYITYAIRDALEKAGYYENAVKKENFCRQVNQELKAAISEGKLETQGGLYSVSYLLGKKGADLQVLIPKFWESFRWIVSYEKIQVNRLESIGKESGLREFEVITNDLLIYPSYSKYRLVGYAFAKDGRSNFTFSIEEGENSVLEFAGNKGSNDVFEHFSYQGKRYENARRCRFDESLENIEGRDLVLHVYLENHEVEAFSLNELTPQILDRQEYILCFDKAATENIQDPLSDGGGIILLGNRIILKIYHVLAYPILILTLAGYLLLVYFGFFSKLEKTKKYRIREWILITGGVFLSTLLVVGGVTYRYAEAVNSGGRDFYLVSAYMMYQLFVVLVLVAVYTCVRDTPIKKSFRRK